ncbi:MAG: flagellin [Planctomycetota bacterium]
MTRINNNVGSLIAQRVLGTNNQSLNTTLERLSTGFRINRGKDDPAGLIASENLRAEKASLGAAIGNAERADQVVNIAEGGLTEIATLLEDIQGLITTTANTAGLSAEEREANQLQIDSILQTIERVAGATSFQGKRLLNGSLDYNTTNVSANVNDFSINGAKIDSGGTRNVDVVVTGSAQVGGFLLSFGGANIDLASADSEFVIEIAGDLGSRELTFASGTALGDIVDAVNSFSEVTGVSAVLSTSNNAIRLESDELGSDKFVSLKVIDDGGIVGANSGVYTLSANDTNVATPGSGVAFNTITNVVRDFGQDVTAFINGIRATTQGTEARINTDFLDVRVDLATGGGTGSATAQELGSVQAFTITGGGADFQLAPQVDIAGKVSVGIQNVAVRDLGRVTTDVGGSSETVFLADLTAGASLNVVDGDLGAAQKTVDEAITQIASLRGRLGAFQQNTVGATIRSLGIAFENTTAAESVIRDADFASETAELTRAQILVASTTQVLQQANTQPQNALQLLG